MHLTTISTISCLPLWVIHWMVNQELDVGLRYTLSSRWSGQFDQRGARTARGVPADASHFFLGGTFVSWEIYCATIVFFCVS